MRHCALWYGSGDICKSPGPIELGGASLKGTVGIVLGRSSDEEMVYIAKTGHLGRP